MVPFWVAGLGAEVPQRDLCSQAKGQISNGKGCLGVSVSAQLPYLEGAPSGRCLLESAVCKSRSPLFLSKPKELEPSVVLPVDCLLAFVYFDANWCGYLHRRDLERILLTLGLRLSAEQVSLPGLPEAPSVAVCRRGLGCCASRCLGAITGACTFCSGHCGYVSSRPNSWSAGRCPRTSASTGASSTAAWRARTGRSPRTCSLVRTGSCGLQGTGAGGLLSPASRP